MLNFQCEKRCRKKAELVCWFVIQLSGIACLSAYYDLLCQHTHHYNTRTCRVQIWICANRDTQKNCANSLGKRAFWNMHVFSKGTAHLFAQHSFNKQYSEEEQRKSLKLGHLRCSADARITETATILGLLRGGHRHCHALRNVKGGWLKMQIINVKASVCTFVLQHTNGGPNTNA